MHKRILYILLCLGASVAMALPEPIESTIQHLLTTIESSQCTFYRNGKSYRSPDVVKHVKFKRNYFKDKIDSPETFIKLAATKSEMSGKLYLIECPDFKMPMGQWLLEALQTYQENNLQ